MAHGLTHNTYSHTTVITQLKISNQLSFEIKRERTLSFAILNEQTQK